MRVFEGMRISILVGFLLLSPAGLEAQGTSPFEFTEEVWVIQGVQIPAVSDTFAVSQINTYPFRELGFVAKYQTPLTRRVTVDLYVYPVADSLSSFSDAEVANREFQKALDELRRYTATNRDGVEVTIENEREIPMDVGDGLIRSGWVAEGTFHRGERTDATLVYVFSWDGLYVKARITHDPEEGALVQPHLEAWLRHNLQQIRKSEAG